MPIPTLVFEKDWPDQLLLAGLIASSQAMVGKYRIALAIYRRTFIPGVQGDTLIADPVFGSLGMLQWSAPGVEVVFSNPGVIIAAEPELVGCKEQDAQACAYMVAVWKKGERQKLDDLFRKELSDALRGLSAAFSPRSARN